MANVWREVFEYKLLRNKERKMLRQIQTKRGKYNHKEGKYLNYMYGE